MELEDSSTDPQFEAARRKKEKKHAKKAFRREEDWKRKMRKKKAKIRKEKEQKLMMLQRLLNKGFVTSLIFPERNDKKVTVKVEIKSFLHILTYLEWPHAFTDVMCLNKVSRKVIMKNHISVCADKQVSVDLSGTTKLLKKMPRWLAVRMNYIKIMIKPDARIDRIQRFMNFFHALGNCQAKLLVELKNIDD